MSGHSSQVVGSSALTAPLWGEGTSMQASRTRGLHLHSRGQAITPPLQTFQAPLRPPTLLLFPLPWRQPDNRLLPSEPGGGLSWALGGEETGTAYTPQ